MGVQPTIEPDELEGYAPIGKVSIPDEVTPSPVPDDLEGYTPIGKVAIPVAPKVPKGLEGYTPVGRVSIPTNGEAGEATLPKPLEENRQALEKIELMKKWSGMLSDSKADDQIKLAEEVIAKGNYDNDTRRVIRQRAAEKAAAMKIEGRLPNPDMPESSWKENLKSIFPRGKAQGGQAVGGIIQNVGEVLGSQTLTDFGKIIFSGESADLKAATPNVPAGSAKEQVANIGVSSLSQVPLLGLNLIPGYGTAISLGGFFSMAYGKKYGEQREAGMSVAPAMLSAFGEGSSEWVTELLPATTVRKVFTNYVKSAGKKAVNIGWEQGARFAKQELSGELINTTTQSLQSWAEKYPNKQFSEWLDTLPGELKDTAIQTFGQFAVLGLLGLPLVKVQRAAYTHGVAKDVVQSTNLPMSEVKPIVKQVMKETKDDESGQTFSIRLQEKINNLVEIKNSEPISLSESMKQDITAKLNDTTGPFKAFSIRDVETVIAKMRETAPKYANSLQAHLDEYKASMTPDQLNQLTIDAEAAKFDTPKSDQERFISNWDKGASNIIRNKPLPETLISAWVNHFPGEPGATQENILKQPAKVSPMPERTAEQDRALQPIRHVIYYGSGTRETVRGATTAEETHAYSKEVRDRIDAGKDYPEHPYIPEVNTYDSGVTVRERKVTQGKVPQQIQVKESDIYDMNTDPNKFWDRAGETVRSMGMIHNQALQRNIFANLVQESGFQGYSAGSNETDNRQTLLFGEHKVVKPESLKVTVSGQVQGAMKPATTLEDATKQGEADLVEIKNSTEEAVKALFPETTIVSEPSVNSYMGQWAGEGEIEPSIKVELKGPPASSRAFAAWLSLIHDQNAVMVSSENGPPTGQNITFEIAPDKGQEFMEEAIKAGLDDIQINNKNGVLSCDLFVPYADLEKIEQIINDSLHKYVINAIDHKDANVEFFNRDKEVHQVIVDFFGREKGERIYEQGKQRGTERSRKVQISERAVREIHGREGDQGKTQPEHANENIPPQEAAGKVEATLPQKLKEWLTGSKSTGVVYHGTDAEEDFKAFKSDKGIWFASSPDTAGRYTASHQGGGQRIIPAYIKVKNPLIIPKSLDMSAVHSVGEFLDEVNKLNNSNLTAEDLALSSNDLDSKHVGFTMVSMDPIQVMSIKNQGFDGIQTFERGEQVWSVFDPTQIKSIYNQGEINPEDILFRKAKPNEPGPHAPGIGVEQGTKHSVWEAFRVWANSIIPHPEKKLIQLKTTNVNAQKQLDSITKILNKFPKATDSPDQWARMMAYALSSDEVPIPPYKFIKDINGTGAEDMLRSLTPGQIAASHTGLATTKEIRDAYLAKSLTPETTGKLSMWAFLSRGLSPYFQESLFMDALKSSSPWIQRAISGNFTKADLPAYLEWVHSIAYKGSGLPSASAASNLNSFGESFLIKMGQKDSHGITNLQRLHDKLSDPKETGKSIRRWFATIGEGVGIDNKVISFMMLAAGHHDVVIIDRIQVGNFWDDGKFKDVNLYDGEKKDGSLVAGSRMVPLFDGARGILTYEALERGVESKIKQIYTNIGRPQDASVSRFHWETWDAASGQEVAHDSLRAILADARGDDVTIASVWVKSGKYGEFAYGTEYNRDLQGQPWFLYRTPLGGEYSFSVPAYRMFIDSIKKPGNKVIPSGFKVSDSTKEAWYERKEVNQSRIEELAKEYADRGSKPGKGQPTNIQATQPVQPAQPQPGGRVAGQVTQGPVPVRARPSTKGSGGLRLTKGTDLAKYSFDLKAPKAPIFNVGEITQMIARPLQRWGDIGKVQVVQSTAELPAKYLTMIKSGDTVFGAYDGDTDTTYLVADSMMNAKSAITTLVHEVIGHRGVLAVLGPIQAKVIMRKIFNAYQNTPVLEKLIRTYNLDITKPKHQRAAAHELIAHMAETNEQPSLYQRIVGMIRAALRIVNPNLKWNDNDIRLLIDRSRYYSGMKPKEITGTYFAKEATLAPTFYSKMARVFESKLPNSGTADQFIQTINSWANKGEFKQDELKWSGLSEWLSEKSGKVTKQEIVDYVKANEIEIQEVVKGEKEEAPFDEEFYESGQGYEEQSPTKFSAYTLPGGKNYREMLFVLPSNLMTFDEFKKEAQYGGVKDEELLRERYQDYLNEPGNDVSKTLNYRSSHWSEPNVLAHTRLNDRVDTEGKKVLFVEEIQSDMHEAGRKYGYKPAKVDKSGWKAERQTGRDLWSVVDANGRIVETSVFANNEAEAIANAENYTGGQVPEAPFAKTWHEFVLKRLLRYAAENGYDSIAWSYGDVQADRYDLSKHISRIEYGEEDGKYNVAADDLNGHQVFHEMGMTEQQVADTLGKEIAHKIVSGTDTGPNGEDARQNVYDAISKWEKDARSGKRGLYDEEEIVNVAKNMKDDPGAYSDILAEYKIRKNDLDRFYKSKVALKTLTGLDLKVGGEGMSGFYDKMIPDFLNKYAKQWGARVGETKIAVGDKSSYENKYYINEEGGGWWAVRDNETDEIHANMERSRAEAIIHMDNVNRQFKPDVYTVHSLPITPPMKESVLYSGQPLFRRGEPTPPTTPINPMVAEVLARARREAAGTEPTTQSIQPPTLITRANPPGENSRFNLDASWIKDLFEKLQFEAQDRFNYLAKFQKAAAEGVTEETDAYSAEVRYHSKVGDRIDSFQEESVKPILDLMHSNGLSTETVDDYLHARHAVEANAQLERINPDLEDNTALSGMTNEQAAEILSTETPALRSIGQMIDRITKATRTILVQSGLESQDTIDTWEHVYQNYVPLYREGTDRQTPGKGKGFDTRGIFKRRTGSTKEVVHILANVISQHESALIRAEKNIVAVSLLKFVQANRGPWSVNPIKFKPTVNAEGLVVYRQDPSYRLADNVVGVRTNGGETYHIVFDENNEEAIKVAHAMNNWNAGDSGSIIRALMRINRWFAMVNTSLSPEFVISNFLRDIQTAGINMSDSEADSIRWKAIKDVGKAWRGIRQYQSGNRDTEWAQAYKLFKQSGGKTGWIESYSNIEDREKALVKIINSMRPGVTGSIHRGIRSVFKFIEDENTAVENGIRLSVFHNLVQSGVTPNRAGVIAKELTVNFNRKGNSGQTLNALYLFYNASIQGSVRMIQAGVKSPKVRMIMGAIVAGSMILDILNRLMAGDDDDGENRYDKIPGWEKSRNLIIVLPSGTGYIKIPLPWGYNVFHVMGQVAGELVTSKRIKTTDGLMRLGSAMVDAFNPIGNVSSLLQTISPTITDPFVQWAENKDWSGRKIRPDNNMFGVKKPSSQLYWNSVRAPSKWVAGMLNRITGGDEVKPGIIDISPEMIDMAIDTLTGSAGKVVGDALSLPFKVFDPTTKIETHEIPFVRRVYGKPGEQAVSAEFYKNIDAVRMAYERRKHYTGNEAKMEQIRKENKVELGMVNRMKATEPILIRIRKAEVALEKQPGSTEKTNRLKELKDRKLNIMKSFNKAYINKEIQNTTFETQGGEEQ